MLPSTEVQHDDLCPLQLEILKFVAALLLPMKSIFSCYGNMLSSLRAESARAADSALTVHTYPETEKDGIKYRAKI